MLKPGDKVVCVDASGPNKLVEGNVYTISFADFIELPHILETRFVIRIHEIKNSVGYIGWRINRFVKLDPLNKLIEELTKMKIKENSDSEKIKKDLEKIKVKEVKKIKSK